MSDADMSDVDDLNFQFCQLFDEYERTSDVAILRKALEVIQDAVDQTASGPVDSNRAVYLSDLGTCQHLLFSATSDLVYLDKAIDAGRESVLATPELSHLRPFVIANLSDSLAARFFAKGAGDDKDLKDALAIARLAVASSHEDSSHRNFALSTLACRLAQYYRFFNGDCYLDEAIQIGRELVSKPSDLKADYIYNLGVHLKIRYGRYGKMEDLIAAKTFLVEALDAFPKGHINHVKAIHLLAFCLIDIAEKTNEAHCLDEANATLLLLEGEAASEKEAAMMFCYKIRLYNQKYRTDNNVSNLATAIEAAEEGLKRISIDSPYRREFLQAMSDLLASRAQAVMSQEDMDAAVEHATKSLDLAKYTPARLWDAYAALGKCLWIKYFLFGGVLNLTASIDAYRKALHRLPEDSAARPTYLHDLSATLSMYFEYTGEVESLNEAIQLGREAASKLEDNNPNLSSMLDRLSNCLSTRAKLTGNSQDLMEAVSASEIAVAHSVVGSKYYRCTYLNNLSACLLERHDIEKNIEDLDRAIVVVREALSAIDGDRSAELRCQLTYANGLEARYRAKGCMHDLDRAIAIQRTIVANESKSSPSRGHSMQNLAISLAMRSKSIQVEDRDEKFGALREALDIAEQCVNETPEDHPSTPLFLRFLASLQSRLCQFLDESDKQLLLGQLKLSATTYQRGYNKAYDTPLNRIRSGTLAGDLYLMLEEWEAASKILSECVNMFRRVSPISLSENDRQRLLQGLSGISSRACASYLTQGKIEQGIEIIEAGRGIMARIAMRSQDDFPAVKEADASLHARYICLRQVLSQSVVPPSFPARFSHVQDVVAERNSAMKEFEEMENLIRAMPGLERFNEGLSSKEMRALAVHGPLVAFCTVDSRCDALIVTTEAIQALPLPDLKLNEIRKHVQSVVGASRLSKASPTKQAAANKRMRALLSWLWDACVSPVLEHLELTRSPANEPQTRLWWITSGPLGLLPLHAAGKGKRQPEHNVFAHVISSYNSSFEALAFARERQSKLIDITWPRIALVTMPQTPGRSTDLNTDDESHAIRGVIESMDTPSQSDQLLELRQCSVEEIVQHLQHRAVDIFHFACHAEADPNDPSKTALLLGSDPKAPSPDLLPIRELRKFYGSSSRVNGPPPRLAYLSACCTAQQYELDLIDESIHLAAAFQLLGFPAVVGTLWEADDSAAVVVARNFYRELFRLDESARHGKSQFPPRDTVARALHSALSACRQQKIGRGSAADEVLLWANFVHIGA